MEPLTLLLLCLIAVFAIGLIALNKIKPKAASSPAVVRQTTVVHESVALNDFAASSAYVQSEQNVSFSAKIAMLSKKTDLMQERLVRIEGILAKLPLDSLKSQFDFSKLEAKVDRLVESRDDIRIELEALREQMSSQQALDRVTQKVAAQEQQTKSFEERLHALAFNRKTPQKKK